MRSGRGQGGSRRGWGSGRMLGVSEGLGSGGDGVRDLKGAMISEGARGFRRELGSRKEASGT